MLSYGRRGNDDVENLDGPLDAGNPAISGEGPTDPHAPESLGLALLFHD